MNKLRFANLLQAEERNFLTPCSYNLGIAYQCSPVQCAVGCVHQFDMLRMSSFMYSPISTPERAAS